MDADGGTENPGSAGNAKLALYRRQRDLLDTFLSTGAIDRRQYDKSLNCLREKMGIPAAEF